MRQFIEQCDDAVLVFDPDRCAVTDLNTAACKLFDLDREMLINNGPRLFCEPGELDNIKRLICAPDPEVRTCTVTYMRPDGTRSVLGLRRNHIRLRDSEMIYCVMRDVGEEIRRHEEDRFRQAQLIHVNKMAALGILVASVAHEISNPNNFIMHNNRILADIWKDVLPVLRTYYSENGDYYVGGVPLSELEEVVPKLVYGMHDGSERISNIVRNLLDFARSDGMHLDSLVDLAKAVGNAVTMMRTEIIKHTNAFSIQIDEHLPQVRGSSQELEQVIINLVLNALQSLEDRSRRVTVTAEFDAGTEQCLVRVSDEGPGISKELMARIMDPFFSTKFDRGGTGLGLYISDSIIRKHKGTMVFTSEPGAGTTVTIRLPAVRGIIENEHGKEPVASDTAR
ncbi:MAG TPA: ATP-binding protein [Dissulfurispiraceae bacterium]|nr:ATP-binding protein [Dissulfurispiraceae bacterium]